MEVEAGSDFQVSFEERLVCECQMQTQQRGEPWISRFIASQQRNLDEMRKVNETSTNWEKIVENPVPLLVVVVVVVFYVIIAVHSIWIERNLVDTEYVIDLHDNDPLNHCYYYVTVFTGNRESAGTSANVAMRLQGTRGKSEVHLLQCSEKQILCQNTVHTMVVATRKKLGNLTAVRFWHDNGGESPEWFLQRLSVLDPQRGVCWLLHCERWFDQELDHVFMVKNPEVTSQFCSVISVKLETYLKNFHLFYSIYIMQTWHRHRMTRFARVLTSFLHVTTLMAWLMYVHPHDGLSQTNGGFYSFRWSHVTTGMRGALIVHPFILMVSALFQFSKQRKRGESSYKCTDPDSYDEANYITVDKRADSFREKVENDDRTIDNKEVYNKRTMTTAMRMDDYFKRMNEQSSIYGGDIASGSIVESEDNYHDSVDYVRNQDLIIHSQSTRSRAQIKRQSIPQQSAINRDQSSRDSNSVFDDSTDEDYFSLSESTNYGSELGTIMMPSSRAADHKTHKWTSVLAVEKAQLVNAYTPAPVSASSGSGFFQFFPWWFVIIAWLVVVTLSVGACTFTIIKGAERKAVVNKEWVVSLIAAIMMSYICLETLKIIVMAFCHALYCLKRGEVDLEDWLPPAMSKPVERIEYDDPKAESIRLMQERRNNPAYRPTSFMEERSRMLERLGVRRARRRLKDLATHLIYLFLLVVATLERESTTLHRFSETFDHLILQSAQKISTYTDVYDWLGTVYLGDHGKRFAEYFPEHQVIQVTTPILRQKRIIKGSKCGHTAAALGINLTEREECRASLSSRREDRGNYGLGWTEYVEDSPPFLIVEKSPWFFVHENVSWLFGYYGKHGVYNGEGYYVLLPINHNTTRHVITDLRRHKWIDAYTRVVIMEMCFYDAVDKVYVIYALIIELSNVGKATLTSSKTFLQSHYVDSFPNLIKRVALYCLLLVILFDLVRIFAKIREERREFFTSGWSVIYFTSTLFSVMEVLLYLTRASITDQAVQAQQAGEEAFHLFHTAANIAYLIQCFFSINIFLTMIYIVKVLEGHQLFELVNKALHRARIDLSGHCFYVIIMFAAFSHWGLLLFGNASDFSNVIRTMQTVLGFSMRAFTSTDLLESYPSLGGIYLLLFLAIFTLIFINFYVTILEAALRESKLLRRDFKQKGVAEYSQKYFRAMLTIKEQKLKEMKTKKEKKKFLAHLKKLKKKYKL